MFRKLYRKLIEIARYIMSDGYHCQGSEKIWIRVLFYNVRTKYNNTDLKRYRGLNSAVYLLYLYLNKISRNAGK